jgi:hypothetical protein
MEGPLAKSLLRSAGAGAIFVGGAARGPPPLVEQGDTMPSPELTLDVWRAAAVALCEYACGFEAGRSKDDAVYKEVTEGRDGPGPDVRKRYSSCGDLAHWLYSRLGIRQPWVNRTDDGVYGTWKPGANITQLWGGACPFDQEPPDDPNWKPEAGDVLLIWNTGFDAHVMVAIGHDGTNLRTANYGAGGMSPLAFPGAKLAAKPITHQLGKPFYGARRIQRWLPLSGAIKLRSAEPNLKGAALTGEEFDAIELNWKDGLL